MRSKPKKNHSMEGQMRYKIRAFCANLHQKVNFLAYFSMADNFSTLEILKDHWTSRETLTST